MLLHAPAIDQVVQFLKPQHFYRPNHQTLFEILVQMSNDRKPVDLVTVHDELRSRKQLEAVGGIDYVAALAEGVPDAANAEYYAGIVRDRALLRELIVAGTELAHEAYETRDDVANVLDRAEQRVFQIANQRIGSDAVELKGLLEQTFASLVQNQDQLITGLGTRFQKLDELTSGFQKGRYGHPCRPPVHGQDVPAAEYGRVHVDHRPQAGRHVLDGKCPRSSSPSDCWPATRDSTCAACAAA